MRTFEWEQLPGALRSEVDRQRRHLLEELETTRLTYEVDDGLMVYLIAKARADIQARLGAYRGEVEDHEEALRFADDWLKVKIAEPEVAG